MIVSFGEIPESDLEMELENAAWFPAKEFNPKGPAHASVTLSRRDNRVLIKGTIKTKIKFECDRCLNSYYYNLGSNFEFCIEYRSNEEISDFSKDYSCLESEMDVVYHDKFEIDLVSILRQQLYLAIPEKKVCAESCLGLCNNCGKNLKDNKCTCSGVDKSSPFSVLANLK